MSRSLFQLEPMKCEQILKLNVKNSIVNSSEGSTKPLPIGDSQQVNPCTTKPLPTEDGSMHDKSVTNGVQTSKSTQKSINALPSAICATKVSNTYGRSKEIACSQLQQAGKQNLSNGASIVSKRQAGTSFSRTKKYPIENSVTHEGYFANDVRKRKRAEDISDESKTSNLTLCKKQKIDCAHSNSTITARIPKMGNPPLSSNNKRNQNFVMHAKRNMRNSSQVNARNEIEMKCRRTTIYNQFSKAQKCNPSLKAVSKPQLGCKWIECKVNHPIKQSKSKIPLLIHQLGSKNESNLVAHMKRIGAYKSLSFHQKIIPT